MSTVAGGIDGCTGCYEERQILHVERRDGQSIVIDHVPALVCSIRGDVLLTPATVRRLDRLVQPDSRAPRSAPMFEYA